MNRTESVYQQNGLPSIVDTSDKLKLGEFFYLRRNNRYSLICVHCYDEFEHFADFTLHIEQHLLRWGIQSVKPMKMENTQGTAPLPIHTGYAGNENLALFKNEFVHGNAGEIPQYFYNGGYNPSNWFPDGQPPINSNTSQEVAPRKSLQQYEDEFNALKRQFNEPMFIINDTPEVRNLSQFLAESFPIEKRNGQYKCPLCDKLFNGSALARRHVFTHSVDKVFSCAVCQRKFSHARHLRDHIRCKHGNPANLPERSTASNRTLNPNRTYDMSNVSHIGNHFMNISGSSSTSHNIGLTGESGSTAFQQEFDALRAQYKDNKSIIVNDLPEIREISQYLMPNYEFSKINDQVMCPLCDGLFNSKSTVRRHITNHLKVKMFKCGECDREFRHARHLGEHIRQKHHSNFLQGNSNDATDHKPTSASRSKSKNEPYDGADAKFECSICHTKFKRRSNLKTVAGSHNGSNSNCCNVCYKELSKRSLNINSMKLPGDDKNQHQHPCAMCGERFTSVDRLRRHMVKHETEVKYKCDVCDMTYTRSEKLLCHRRAHKEPMKFYCKFCNLGFMEQKSYVLHEIQHTKSYANDATKKVLKPDMHGNGGMPLGMPIQ